jgi:hypothetical protein
LKIAVGRSGLKIGSAWGSADERRRRFWCSAILRLREMDSSEYKREGTMVMPLEMACIY